MSGSDQVLFEHWVRARDAEAFRELAARYSGMVFATCLRVLGNAATAEDVAQECFETLARTKSAPSGYLGAWLHRVATNRALNHLKAERRRMKREKDYARTRTEVKESAPDDVYAYVDKAVEALPEKLRLPLVAHFFEGQSHTEIAENLGASRQTVTHRIQQGIEKARRALARQGVTIAPVALGAVMAAARAEAAAVPAALTTNLGKLAVAGPSVASQAGLFAGTGTVGGMIMSAKKTTVIIAAVLAVLGGLYVLPLTFEDSPAPAVETAEQAKANEAIPDPELSVTETAGASAAGVETRMDPGSDSGASFRGDDASEEDSEAGPGTPEKAPKEKDALPPKGSISGRILSTRHEGLAGAEVQLIQRLASGGGPRAVTQSGEDGSYRFLDVKEAQTYVVRAAYEGYSTSDSRAVIMRADKTVTDVDIYLGGGFAVHGRVLDSKGNGVDDLLVQLLEGGQRAFNPIPNLNAVSGYDGAFVIANVGPGEYAPLVQTSKKNRADQSQVRGTDFTMPDNADLYDVDIVIGDQVEGFVSGRVTGTQGEPVYWVELVAFSGNLLGVAKSDEEGYYRIEGLGGAETVSMEVKGFASGYGRTKRQGVPVNSDNVDFVLKEAGAVSGRVVDAVTGEPLTEFAVQWRQYWPWQDFQLESGEFTLKQIEEEEVVLRVRAPGYATGKSDAITVPPGETVEDITIPLTRGNELAGVVVDAVSGQPIQGVRIKPFEGYRLRSEALRMGWGPQDPITDAQGRFRIGGMEPGTVVNLVASHEAYAPAVLLDLPTDSEDELVFALGRGSAVTGTVRRGPEPAGANIVFFRIDFRPEPADPFSFHAFCAVDSLGEFERRGLPPGRYVVMCFEETENGRTQEPAWQERREFFDGETYELSIQLEETGAIVGQVAGHQPGERIQIQVETPDWSGDPYMIAYTESDGSFVFEALPPGDYIIGVSDMPEFNREVTVAPGELVAVAIDLGTDSEV